MILSGFPLIFCLFCSVSDGKSCFNVRKSFWPENGMRSTGLLVEIHNFVSFCLSLSLYIWQYICLSLCVSFSLSVPLTCSICLPVRQPGYLHLSVYMSVFLYVCVYVCIGLRDCFGCPSRTVFVGIAIRVCLLLCKHNKTMPMRAWKTRANIREWKREKICKKRNTRHK